MIDSLVNWLSILTGAGRINSIIVWHSVLPCADVLETYMP